jgi:hypothetical protein
MKTERSTPCPMTGSGRKKKHNDATQVQMRSQVDHRPVSGQVRRAELPNPNQRWRPRLLLPERSSPLRLRLRSWGKAERDFAAHRIDEDGY